MGLVGVGGKYEAHGEVLDFSCDGDLADEVAQGEEFAAFAEDFIFARRRAARGPVEDGVQFIRSRVGDFELEEEAVELCFG